MTTTSQQQHQHEGHAEHHGPRARALPDVVDRAAWLEERNALLVREKAHTHEGDAIAAARRRLPMTEVAVRDLVGDNGPTSLLDIFDGRDELLVYKHMFHTGMPIEDQCEGCTFSVWNLHDTSYLAAAGISFAVFCEGPWDEAAQLRDFMGYTLPWYSVAGVDDPALAGEFGTLACFVREGDRVFLTYDTTGRGIEAILPQIQLLDMTPFGRREAWQDSPEGRVGEHDPCWYWRKDGRPTAQWTRPGATPVDPNIPHRHHH
ncbi:DUF899 family protein [Antribacter gilvus]|uniref:DUF899 family protein n=1 Tax=Antribacter gilvus TaxID=2304675 RepID=UPI000F7A569F|nr:DUF899 family protein [Antribacter gilvus]